MKGKSKTDAEKFYVVTIVTVVSEPVAATSKSAALRIARDALKAHADDSADYVRIGSAREISLRDAIKKFGRDAVPYFDEMRSADWPLGQRQEIREMGGEDAYFDKVLGSDS